MAETLWVREGRYREPTHGSWIQAIGRAFLWLSVVVITLTALGFGAFGLSLLAHHAAPAGGGG
jgi:hypothetical protein